MRPVDQPLARRGGRFGRLAPPAPCPSSCAMLTAVATVFIYARDARNIEHGVLTGVWGMPSISDPPRPKGDGASVAAGDLLVLLTGLKGPVPRGTSGAPAFDVWAEWAKTEGVPRFVDATIAAVVSGVTRHSRPFWPGENPNADSIYPWRFEIDSAVSLGQVEISRTNFTTDEVLAIRSSAIQPAPVRLSGPSGPLLAGVAALASSPEALAAGLRGLSSSSDLPDDVGSRRRRVAVFGRDAERNRVVEARAVNVVTCWFTARGWHVTSRERDVRWPGYDLECRSDEPGAAARHVEVKGTTGLGDEVLVSPNEVRFARGNPATAELFIVGHIQVQSDADGLPCATGGELVHSGPWTNLDHGPTPTGYSYAHQP